MSFKFITLLAFSLILTSCATSDKKAEQAELYYSHGTAKLVEKDYTEALEYLLKAADLSPDSKIMNNLGMAYYFKEQNKLAEQSFLKALEYDAKNSDARNNLASIYFKTNRMGDAEREYKKVLEDLVYFQIFRVYYNLALISEKKGDRKKMVELLTLSVKSKDDYCPAHFRLGQNASQQLRLKEALEHFKKGAQGVCYSLPASHYEQGIIYAKLGDNKKAYEKFSEIIARFPTSTYAPIAEKHIRTLGRDPYSTTFEEQIIREHEENLKQSRLDSDITQTPQF